MSRRTRWFLCLICIAAAWLSGLFWFVRDTAAMMPPLVQGPVDAIVVLTGEATRLETGFTLLKEGKGKKTVHLRRLPRR